MSQAFVKEEDGQWLHNMSNGLNYFVNDTSQWRSIGKEITFLGDNNLTGFHFPLRYQVKVTVGSFRSQRVVGCFSPKAQGADPKTTILEFRGTHLLASRRAMSLS
ncbi:hypothetical protein [Pseudoflavitalea rhizosphaerae]|uniref:hypothetical protein n=1 Tax=Pseudoflavitalea rhizosphaerae TaxID=1884793 RepID=UPI000F8E928F|nr:hypothetical protein [Pseudoflavitalea rhizosphaerae]